MKSITIHGIDKTLDQKIAAKAAEFGLSQNRTVKQLLQSSLGNNSKDSKRESFSELFGKWSKKDKEEFDKNTSDLEIVNETDWTK